MKKILFPLSLILSLFFSFISIPSTASFDLSVLPSDHHRKVNRFLLITGCGRSGTTYTYQVLKASGLDVTHERGMGSLGCVSWLMAAEIDWAPWGPLSNHFKFAHIFHQVRNPLGVIQSVYNFPPLAGWPWIQAVIPQILPTDNNITKSAKYWYYWNLMAEARAEWTYRIEDIDRVYPIMGKRLGLKFKSSVPDISRKTNSRGFPQQIITWDYLKENLDPELFQKVRDLATRYGYLN